MEILIGKKVKIVSDNDSYAPYMGLALVIIERYFEEGKDEEPIYDFSIVDSNDTFPFSLYEWEFELL